MNAFGEADITASDFFRLPIHLSRLVAAHFRSSLYALGPTTPRSW
jgi:hypothetical protein